MRLLLPFTRSYGEIKRLARENAERAKPLSPTIDFVFKTLFSGRGEDFKEAKRVYVIFFLDFVLFPQSAKVPRRYVLMEESEHDRLNELIEVVYYEMPKTADAVKEYL